MLLVLSLKIKLVNNMLRILILSVCYNYKLKNDSNHSDIYCHNDIMLIINISRLFYVVLLQVLVFSIAYNFMHFPS